MRRFREIAWIAAVICLVLICSGCLTYHVPADPNLDTNRAYDVVQSCFKKDGIFGYENAAFNCYYKMDKDGFDYYAIPTSGWVYTDIGHYRMRYEWQDVKDVSVKGSLVFVTAIKRVFYGREYGHKQIRLTIKASSRARAAVVGTAYQTLADSAKKDVKAKLLTENTERYEATKSKLTKQIEVERKAIAAIGAANVNTSTWQRVCVPRQEFEDGAARRLALAEKVYEAHKQFIQAGNTECPIQSDFKALELLEPVILRGSIQDARFLDRRAVGGIPEETFKGCGIRW